MTVKYEISYNFFQKSINMIIKLSLKEGFIFITGPIEVGFHVVGTLITKVFPVHQTSRPTNLSGGSWSPVMKIWRANPTKKLILL